MISDTQEHGDGIKVDHKCDIVIWEHILRAHLEIIDVGVLRFLYIN